jgi:deoxyribonuclease-4
MLFGVHVSAAKSLALAPKQAHEVGAEVFQFFSRSPRGGAAPKITPALAAEFKAACKKFRQAECYIHTPYYINLASINGRIYYGSIAVIRDELERGSLLGVKYVMTHLGSARELGRKQAIPKVIAGLRQALHGYHGSTRLLLEIAAGSGAIIGDTFEEIAKILRGVGHRDVGVCFDTAHAFASGYDLRTTAMVKATIRDFNRIIGLSRLKLIHCNDSKVDLGSHKDRHEHIGLGKIGLGGFKALLAHPKLRKINFSLETPEDDIRGDKGNLTVMKKLRK